MQGLCLRAAFERTSVHRHSRTAGLDPQLGAAPVPPLRVVANLVVCSEANPVRDRPVLLRLLGEHLLGAEGLLGRHPGYRDSPENKERVNLFGVCLSWAVAEQQVQPPLRRNSAESGQWTVRKSSRLESNAERRRPTKNKEATVCAQEHPVADGCVSTDHVQC